MQRRWRHDLVGQPPQGQQAATGRSRNVYPQVPDKAHLVQRLGLTRAYVLGEGITALCGQRFVPTRDPAGLTLCAGCEAMWRRLSDNGPKPAPRRRL